MKKRPAGTPFTRERELVIFPSERPSMLPASALVQRGDVPSHAVRRFAIASRMMSTGLRRRLRKARN